MWSYVAKVMKVQDPLGLNTTAHDALLL